MEWEEAGTTKILHMGQHNKDSSIVFNSVLLARSNDGGSSSELGYYCAIVIALGLHVLAAGGGLPTSVPVI